MRTEKQLKQLEEARTHIKNRTCTEETKRKKARSILNHYLRDNNIHRQPCEICGNKKAEAHHDDYDKPLEIRWLCFNCHRQWHKEHDSPELLKGGER